MTTRPVLLALATLLLALVITGCFSMKELPVEQRSRTFNAEPQEVYDTAVAWMARQGYVVQQASPETMTITSDYKIKRVMLSTIRERVSMFIDENNAGRTMLTMNVTQEMGRGEGEWGLYRTQSRFGGIYQEYLDSLASVIE